MTDLAAGILNRLDEAADALWSTGDEVSAKIMDDAQAVIQAQADENAALVAEIEAQAETNKRVVSTAKWAVREAASFAILEAAGKALYLAGKWELHDTDILPYEQAVMWGNLRDALGLPPGTATALTARGETE